MDAMITRRRGYLRFREDPAPPNSVELETKGFSVIRSVFTEETVAELRTDIDRVFQQYPPDGRNPNPDAHSMFRYEMLNRSRVCQDAIGHSGILEVIEPLLGEDCHVIANTAWQNPPAKAGMHGGERWHIDAGPHIPLPEGTTWPNDIPHPVFAIGVHIFLMDCNLEDGPTGAIAGSHLSGRPPPAEQLLDDDLTYQGESATPLLARAGDVALFVSDVWHRRMTTMEGDHGRYFLQVHYSRRDIAQRLHTSQMTNQLSPEAIQHARQGREQTLIGLHTPLFYDG